MQLVKHTLGDAHNWAERCLLHHHNSRRAMPRPSLWPSSLQTHSAVLLLLLLLAGGGSLSVSAVAWQVSHMLGS
jgi:hypothetical protein